MNYKTFILSLLLLLMAPSHALFAQARKRALLVGVGQYPATSGWTPLNAGAGLKLMRQTLLAQGFSENDILVLSDAAATRAGIAQAFDTHLLQRCASGDIALFYYYGHGDRLPDDNRDETDGYDEALVPADARKGVAKSCLRDDELGQWVETLRRNTGPTGQTVVLLDACHAGTGLRSGDNGSNTDDRHHLNTDKAADNLSPLVAIYSSLPQEPSLEVSWENGERCALLTHAFCKAMAQAHSESTWRGVFDRVVLLMSQKRNKQTPQAEGTLDLRIFGEKVAPPPPYFKTYAVLGEREIQLSGGSLNGLQPGAELALYPVDTHDTTGVAPLARGEVSAENAGLLECRLLLDRPLSRAELESAWAFVTKRRFNGYSLTVQIGADDPVQARLLHERLAGMPMIQLGKPHPELLVRLKKGKQLQLSTADSSVFWETKYSARAPGPAIDSLQNALANYCQAQFLRGLEFEGSPYRMEFSVRAETPGDGDAVLPVLRKSKDVAVLTVTNRGDRDLYYTVLDIDAANRVKVLLPPKGWSPAEFMLERGQSREHRVRFHEPGREVLKLIATPTSIDLRPVLELRGRSTTRGKTFFEQMFNDSFVPEPGRNRGPEGTYRGNEAGVSTVGVEVR